ncbi:hypothetical protein DFH09DRAFT_133325 [Mycena vulgaris]|nr:hypothetical protein DFH09DRAFT_133325 [Mycena vulgaris]
MLSITLITLALCLSVSARPMRRRSSAGSAFALKNGQDAIALNNQFKTLTATSPCSAGQHACVNDKFAQCVGGKFVLQACGAGTICAALPLDNSAGTIITCTTADDLQARIAATGATNTGSTAISSAGTAAESAISSVSTASSTATTASDPTATAIDNSGSGGATDLQTSLTLDPSVIAPAFASDGAPKLGQSPSLTTTNNFINFCALTLPATPLTNGQQITNGSCNPVPIGLIPKSENMPSAKFVNPPNLSTVPANQNLTIVMNIGNLEAGNFVNAETSYFAAPQQLNKDGLIIGHSHVVVTVVPITSTTPSNTIVKIEPLTSLTQTTITNPLKFLVFQGINAPAVDGAVSLTINKGVPAGFYRLCSINTAANHQPVIVPIAQHGSLDDCIYFTSA